MVGLGRFQAKNGGQNPFHTIFSVWGPKNQFGGAIFIGLGLRSNWCLRPSHMMGLGRFQTTRGQNPLQANASDHLIWWGTVGFRQKVEGRLNTPFSVLEAWKTSLEAAIYIGLGQRLNQFLRPSHMIKLAWVSIHVIGVKGFLRPVHYWKLGDTRQKFWYFKERLNIYKQTYFIIHLP